MLFALRFGARPWACLGLALLLSACGGEDDAQPAGPQLRAEQTLGAGGGSLSIDAATLTLPPAALTADTPVSLESLPLDDGQGAQLRLQVAPAGVRLAGEATLAVTLPGASQDTAAYWMANGTPLLADFSRQGDQFVVRLRSLGFDANGQRAALAGGQGGRETRAARERPLADTPSAGELRLATLDCQRDARHLTEQLRALAASEDAIAKVEQLGEALIATVQRCQTLEVQQMQQAACEALQDAVVDVNLTLPTSSTEMNRIGRRLLGAEAAVQKAGASCETAPDVSTLLAERMADFLAVLSGQLRRGDFASQAGARELGVLFAIQADCQLLGLETGCDRLRTQIFPDLLDGMREAAFNECRERGTSLPVAQFLDLGVIADRSGPFMDLARFRTSEVEADLMQCTAPQLGVRVFDTVSGLPQALPGRDLLLQPMRAFNDYRTRAEVRVPRNGNIVLEGPVAVARCPDGSALAADLVVRTAGNPQVEVARRPHNGTRFTLNTAPIDLSVPQLLAAAGLDPASATNVGLIVRQEDGGCVSTIDPSRPVLDVPVLLFQLDLVVDAASTTATTWSGSVTADVSIVITMRGQRDQADSTLGTLRVAELTTETLDLNMGYSVNLPVPSGTELLPGIPVRVQGRLPDNVAATGAASVNSRFTFPPSGLCVEQRADSATLSGAVATNGVAEGSIELTPDGQLRIRAGGLRGSYLANSQGLQTGNVCSTSAPRTFSQAFGPRGVSSEFLDFSDRTVLTPSAGADGRFTGSSTARNQVFFSTASCHAFLLTHLQPMAVRLIATERVVSCEQVVQLSWQLVRD